jgi:hypothetical protein
MTVRRKATQDTGAHRFLQLLHHVGWAVSALEKPRAAKGYQWLLAPLPDGTACAIVFMDDPLPSLDEPFRRYEDLLPVHRLLLRELAEESAGLRHLLVVDPLRTVQLLDAAQEDILVETRDESSFSERLLPLLNLGALARGSLSSYLRKAPRQRAKELEDWTRLWSNRLGGNVAATREQTAAFFYSLHLTRLAEQLAVGPVLPDPLSRFGEPGKAPSALRRLLALMKPLAERWNLLQLVPWKALDQFVRRANEGDLLLTCLQSYARLSRAKFSADLFGEAFADEELRHIGWRQHLVEGVPVLKAEDPQRWLVDPAVVSLEKLGIPGVLAQLDHITEDLRGLARSQAIRALRGERPGLQLDLLAEEPEPFAEEDSPRTALQRSLRVTTGTRARQELLRFVLLAHAVEWTARLHRLDVIFPEPQVILLDAGKPLPVAPSAPVTAKARERADLN